MFFYQKGLGLGRNNGLQDFETSADYMRLQQQILHIFETLIKTSKRLHGTFRDIKRHQGTPMNFIGLHETSKTSKDFRDFKRLRGIEGDFTRLHD